MRLEIDIGNTRIKWRLIAADECVLASDAVITSQVLEQQNIAQVWSDVDLSGVSVVYVASVVPACHPLLISWCRSVLSISPMFAQVTKRCADVVNAYGDVSQMGVDRWLAMLATYNRHGGRSDNSIVVSAGSAVTVDLLSATGEHLGGYIVPGLRLMNQALFANTGQVKVELSLPPQLLPGQSTHDAVSCGLPIMLVGLIRFAEQQLAQAVAGRVRLVVTGGDSEYLVSQLREHGFDNALQVPELVFDGLRFAIEGGPAGNG